MGEPPPLSAPVEAWIPSLRWGADDVAVGLVLDNGRPVGALVDRDRAEWLELARGQIVRVRPSAGDPGFLLVG